VHHLAKNPAGAASSGACSALYPVDTRDILAQGRSGVSVNVASLLYREVIKTQWIIISNLPYIFFLMEFYTDNFTYLSKRDYEKYCKCGPR
jgi:hypothetical protein